jgi:predicted homoserine dehydrogenase-like protein
MYGPACDNVREIANLLPPEDMLEIGLVDYALGAAPHTGAFAITYEDSQLKRLQLSYYKLGGGPFYVFYTPFHLPHIQIASTIGRAFIHRDPTVAPIGGPICEVVTVAKRDLKARERLDGVGGFCTYGLIENAQAARVRSDLPIGLSEGCILRRDVSKDAVLSFEDVDMLANGIVKDLWREQFSRWQVAPIGTGASSQTNAQLT